MVNLIGTIGVVLLALCALPQALKSIKQGHSQGITPFLLWPWLFGELFTFIYLIFQFPIDIILISNYAANIIFVGIITYYKYFPR